MSNPLTLKLEQRDVLSEEERNVLEHACGRTRDVEAGQEILREGDQPKECSLLLDGWAARYKIWADGKRQIMAIHLVGDFVDLHSFLLKPMDHAIGALTRCRLAIVPHDTLREITESYPHLGRLLWLNSLIDGATHRQWLAAMGRRSALEHLAHLLCELFLRLKAVGQTEDYTLHVPLTQMALGDSLGLSTVHVNRIVQRLRRDGVITWRGEVVTIEDWERLRQIAQFDPTYLNLNPEPR